MAAASGSTTSRLGADRALFTISAAAEVTGVSPQMLRVYEQHELLKPHRTPGGTRRYTGRDLSRVAEIAALLQAGLNLAGVEHVLHLRAANQRLQMQVDQLRARGNRSPDGAR